MPAMREGTQEGSEVWSWQSEDGVVKGHAILEKNTALTIHFSSNDMSLEGARLNINIGPFSQESTFKRLSDSEVYGRVEISRRKRPKDLTGIRIEVYRQRV
jgi:hypothetical protein